MRRTLFRTLILGSFFIGGLPTLTSASTIPIAIYAAPAKTYQNTTNNPCVFYGPGNCPHDPANWLSPASPTNQDFAPLTQTYDGTVSPDTDPFTSFARFSQVSGGSFILGLDVNQTDDPQSLTAFTIDFFNASHTLLASYAFSPVTPVPALANGSGFADYILAAGCAGTLAGSGIQTCSQYLPFVLPANTASATFGFSYGKTGNDGPDKVFLVPTLSPDQHEVDDPTVPEPASLMLLGGGLVTLATRVRRRRRK